MREEKYEEKTENSICYVFFWYLVKSDLSSLRYCTYVH